MFKRTVKCWIIKKSHYFLKIKSKLNSKKFYELMTIYYSIIIIKYNIKPEIGKKYEIS